MAFDLRNLIRPVAPGLSGAVNPLAFIGAGMATGDMGSQLARMGQLQQTGMQLAAQQQEMLVKSAEAQRKMKVQQAMQAIAPGVAKELYPSSPSIQALLASNPELMADLVKQQAGRESWKTLTPQEAEAQGFKPGSVVQQSTLTGQLRTPGAAGVNITNLPAPAAGYEYYEGPEGQLQARKIPGGPAEKPTEKQMDVAAFLQNAEMASSIIDDLEAEPTAVMAAANPLTRLVVSDAAKRTYDAQLAWTWATLRAESGATVTEQEARNQMSIFFPMPGDSATVLADKERLRAEKERTMRQRAGNAIEGAQEPTGETAETFTLPDGGTARILSIEKVAD